MVLPVWTALLLGSTPLAAQVAAPDLESGERVRLTTRADRTAGDSLWKYGRFRELSGDSLTVQVEGAPEYFALKTVRRFEVARGERSHTVLGAVIGVGVGAGIGALLSGYDSVADREELIIGVVGGGVAGALLGSQVRSDRWIDVALSPHLSASFETTENGFRLALRLE